MRRLLAILTDMLSYCRPAGTATERAYRERFILPIDGAYVDEFDNIHVERGNGRSRVLFSSHTDTVHWRDGRQSPVLHDGIIRLPKRDRQMPKTPRARYNGPGCLGADDTIGNFIMIQMIAANVPGHYIFHDAEEHGGIGSRALAEARRSWLRSRFDQAVAFDRHGLTDVITRQMCGTCASDVYASALAAELNDVSRRAGYKPFHYAPSDRGMFTDTAFYSDIIPECTNVAVGYYAEHTPDEHVDARHVIALTDVVCRLDWDDLPIARRPDVDREHVTFTRQSRRKRAERERDRPFWSRHVSDRVLSSVDARTFDLIADADDDGTLYDVGAERDLTAGEINAIILAQLKAGTQL